jgi:putative membrane protein
VVRRFLLTWLANFLGLLVASTLLKGIAADGLTVILIASLIFGVVNALLRPFLVILSLPAIVLTFGLFSLIINTLLLYITSAIYSPFKVESVWSAIAAVIVVWLANYIMGFIIDKEEI